MHIELCTDLYIRRNELLFLVAPAARGHCSETLR